MCNFISWVAVDGDEIFFLTDEKVFSAEGRLRLRGTRDNDILGHTAIRRFHDLYGGYDREDSSFWLAPEQLPMVLRPLLATWKSIDATWGRMLRQALTAKDFPELLCAPADIAEGAWGIIMERPDRGEILQECLTYTSSDDPYTRRALDALVTLPDAALRLSRIIRDSDFSGVRRMAGRSLRKLLPVLKRKQMVAALCENGGDEDGVVLRQFLARRPRFGDLWSLWGESADWTSDELKYLLEKALVRHPRLSLSRLADVMCGTEKNLVKRQAWERIKSKRPPTAVLHRIANEWVVPYGISREAERMLRSRA